jgi:hypothetical protein
VKDSVSSPGNLAGKFGHHTLSISQVAYFPHHFWTISLELKIDSSASMRGPHPQGTSIPYFSECEAEHCRLPVFVGSNELTLQESKPILRLKKGSLLSVGQRARSTSLPDFC